jgi:hypothetical protein
MIYIYLKIGLLIFLTGAFVVFPLEEKNYLDELQCTFLTLIIGTLIALYGFLGSNFLKGLLFIFFCVSVSMLFLTISLNDSWGKNIMIFWLGVPSGAITAIIFIILNHFYFIKKDLKQISKGLFLIVIYTIIVSIMRWGGDILFYLE